MSTKQFHISNFGCRTSQAEGAAIEEQLVHSGASLAESPWTSDVVVVNSCTVTAEADRDVRQLIRRISKRNPNAQIIVTGCYAQRAPSELAEMDGVRYVVGNSHKPLVGELARGLLDAETSLEAGRAEVFCSDVFVDREWRVFDHAGSGGRTRAVVKIQDGCNANCSFCIIPSVRGRSRSLLLETVLAEVETLVGRGYREVVFSGIHLGTYGRDLPMKVSFAELIQRTLDAVPNLERLRLSSIEPLETTPEIVELATRHPRVARHLHIPLQSGSAGILRQMRRPYRPEEYATLLESIRAQSGEASIGADVMVGFPGETDADFAATYGLIESSPLTYLHVFPYSSRPGTPAAAMTNPVPGHVSRFRGKSLRDLIKRKNVEFRRSMVGRELDVLVLEAGEALSSNFIRTEVDGETRTNQWTRLRVTEVTAEGIRGTAIA